ncbi:hypothetical protein I6F65_08995 [Pseudoalteromonas sp. SWXJZ94C]|uniref:hypothetical protein n=1 Tax=Pseudoalteromonas sp. SWXJZ94C TaxID=2792065 RepID=UPI0018CFCBE2|nr:hypothetical protein [Pseudoalteromonas sp. SWXJZ94C]MBH0057097.1 hypothetical protein [Pseudoalteromonas sp. SWXJZ94C]
MPHKSNLFAIVLSFFMGVGLASGYFLHLYTPSNNKTAKSAHTDQNIIIEVNSNKPAQKPFVNTERKAFQQPVEQEHVETISALSNELAVTKKQLKLTQQQLKQGRLEGADFTKQLDDKFDEESENTLWSFDVETALTDFLIVSDLSNNAQLNYITCKQTICKFELLADKNNEQGHAQWRELNDKLVTMPWWQQFKMTSSSSTDERIEFTVSTKE